ncbi:MAG: hypothetical protein OEW11_00040 [Nitrospirota bacterium]|nr:hypothetical protein [Nitrospirota bacterium]
MFTTAGVRKYAPNVPALAGLVVAVGLAMGLATGTPALACGPDEYMTHVGTVAAIDPAAMTLTLVDAETGKNLVFKVTAEQIATLTLNGRVSINYAEDNGALVAQKISV